MMRVVRLFESLFVLRFKDATKYRHRLEPVLTRKMQNMNQEFQNLLKHLQQPSSKLEIRSLAGAIAHYMATLPLPYPTTVAASVMASPRWDDSNLTLLLTAFRQAVHTKRTILSAEPGSLLSPTRSTKFKQWMRGVYDGLTTRNVTLRGAALGGLLLGMEDVKEELDAGVVGSRVEDEVVVAFAELFGAPNTGDDWEQEFRPSTKSTSS